MTTTAFGLRYSTNVGFEADFGGRGFQLPTSIAIRSDGVIYLLSRGKASTAQVVGIQKVTRDHDFLGQFGASGRGLGQMVGATSITLDTDENAYVADESLHRITKFDYDGKPLSMWGEKGSAEGQFDQPSGLLVQGDTILVVDSGNDRVQRYSLGGEFITQWGRLGTGDGEFNHPWGLGQDSSGNVYIADWRNDRIQKFTSEGQHLATFGESGISEGQLSRPADVAVDPEGNIYVADWGNQRLQVFDSEWNFLDTQRGEAGMNPWAVEYLASQDDER